MSYHVDINQEYMISRSREDDNGCWIWTKYTAPDGYGRMGEPWYHAHRCSYFVFVGDFDRDLKVIHSCRVRNCVNPNHLFLGTDQDHVDHKMDGDRQAHGEGSGHNVLSEEDVRRIRQLFAEGRTQYSVAKEYGVTFNTIHHIFHNRTWTRSLK